MQGWGWIYVVTNQAIPGLVKIGYTTRVDIEQRLREFNQAGLPYPYEAAYTAWVNEPRWVEGEVHSLLEGHRENKEWFRCSVEVAKKAIAEIAGPFVTASDEEFEEALRGKTQTHEYRYPGPALDESGYFTPMSGRELLTRVNREQGWGWDLDLGSVDNDRKRDSIDVRAHRIPWSFWGPIMLFMFCVMIGSC